MVLADVSSTATFPPEVAPARLISKVSEFPPGEVIVNVSRSWNAELVPVIVNNVVCGTMTEYPFSILEDGSVPCGVRHDHLIAVGDLRFRPGLRIEFAAGC